MYLKFAFDLKLLSAPKIIVCEWAFNILFVVCHDITLKI